MQMLIHVPDELALRFKAAVPSRKRSEFIAKLLTEALPEEQDPLYLAALDVENDAKLCAEMHEWREALVGDGVQHETR